MPHEGYQSDYVDFDYVDIVIIVQYFVDRNYVDTICSIKLTLQCLNP